MRVPPSEFVTRLRTTFPGERWDVFYEEAVGRWALRSPSAAGNPVTQYWGWFYDATTGNPIPPDPVTGLHPFRELDRTAQDEIIRNLQRSFIGKTGDGRKDWSLYMQERRAHNTALRKARTKARAEQFADLLSEFDIRRPGWRKDYQTGAR